VDEELNDGVDAFVRESSHGSTDDGFFRPRARGLDTSRFEPFPLSVVLPFWLSSVSEPSLFVPDVWERTLFEVLWSFFFCCVCCSLSSE